MASIRREAVVSADGTLVLHDLPDLAGCKVAVSVEDVSKRDTNGERYPLRGTSVRYIRPFDAVAEDEWNANE